MTHTEYIGIKQAKILGICKAYGNIDTDIVTKIYNRNCQKAKECLKSLVKKGYLIRIGHGIFTINQNKKIDWQENKKVGSIREGRQPPEETKDKDPFSTMFGE